MTMDQTNEPGTGLVQVQQPVFIAGFQHEGDTHFEHAVNKLKNDYQLILKSIMRLTSNLAIENPNVLQHPHRAMVVQLQDFAAKGIDFYQRSLSSNKTLNLASICAFGDQYFYYMDAIAWLRDQVLRSTDDELIWCEIIKATTGLTLLITEMAGILRQPVPASTLTSGDEKHYRWAIWEFNLACKGWREHLQNFKVTKQEMKRATNWVLLNPSCAFKLGLPDFSGHDSTFWPYGDFDNRLMLQRLFTRMKAQWRIWQFLLPEWQYHDIAHAYYINLGTCYWWQENICGLPECFMIDPISQDDLEAHIWTRLILASAVDSSIFDFALLNDIRRFISKNICANQPSIGEVFFPLNSPALIYGLAMALITKIDLVMKANRQCSALNTLSILWAYQLTKSIRAPEELSSRLEEKILSVQRLMFVATQNDSQVLKVIYRAVYSKTAQNPADILNQMVLDRNYPHVKLNERVILLGDTPGFVCITGRKFDRPGHRFYDQRIVFLNDQVMITKNKTAGIRGFKVNNVHEVFNRVYVRYCWRYGPDRQDQDIANMVMDLRNRKISAHETLMKSLTV